ncbi:MAG: hypothetical protein ACQEUZ_01585 [Pseudomonadota bacterium]
MLNEILFEELAYAIFLAACIASFVRVFRRPQLFLTFPVVAGAIWLVYIAPQAFGILYNPIHLSSDMFQQGYAQTMIMCTLCVLMGIWGWRARLGGKKIGPEISAGNFNVHPRRLMVSGSVLTLLGIAAFFLITSQTGGIIGYYSIGGSYALDWRGSEVIASFFMLVFLNLGAIILLFSFFLRPALLTAIMALIALAPTIADIVILNRRGDVVNLAISVMAPAFFVRNWVPSRSLILGGAVVGMFVVFTFPVIRGAFLIGAKQDVNILEAFHVALFDQVLGGTTHKEFNNSIGIVASTDQVGSLGYGAFMWNSWIKTSIPRTLFGQDAKDFLSFTDVSLDNISEQAYGWTPVWYQSRSAAALLFADFWYFGCLLFYGMGHAFAAMFSGMRNGDIARQIQYSAFLLLLPHWIAEGFYKAPRNIIMTIFILGIVMAYARASRLRRGSRAQPSELHGPLLQGRGHGRDP